MLDGQNIRDMSLHSLRRNIGIVQQDVYLLAGTVADNIGYGKPDATQTEIIEAAKKANAHSFMGILKTNALDTFREACPAWGP